MNIEKSKSIVKEILTEVLDSKIEIKDEMQLIGGEALLDSMKLVEVCLSLEDAADDKSFEFDWTSESAMSKSRSMFRTVEALAEEFLNQSNKGS
jgi:acyl carrier protein